jgi:UPF0755 protein
MNDTPPEPARQRWRIPVSHRLARSVLSSIVLLSIAVALTALGGFLLSALKPVSMDRNAPRVLVTVPHGATDQQIGVLLASKGLVRIPMGFVFAARIAGLSGKMQSGTYDLSPAMSPRQIATLIELGMTVNETITVPEGFTLKQIARRLAAKNMVDEERFLTICRTQGRTFEVDGWRPPTDNLEGYLFPDTYRVPKGADERMIVDGMLKDFARQVLPLYRETPGKKPNLSSVVTLASLIE